MSDRAVIEATLEGGSRVASEAKKIRGALVEAKKGGEEAAGGVGQTGSAVKGLGSEIGNLLGKFAGGGMGGLLKGLGLGAVAVTGVKEIVAYLGSAKEAAQDFQERTARGARRLGMDVGGLRQTFSGLEVDTHQSAEAQQDFLGAMQSTAYTGRQSIDSLRGLGREATASGKDLAEFVPIVGSLQRGLGVVGDVTSEIDKLRAMSERLGTVGGPQAFIDTMSALRPTFEQIAVGSDQARTRVEALVAVLSQRLKPDQARAVGAGAVSMIKARALDIERVTGQGSVLDENGQVKDPVAILKALRAQSEKRHGKGTAQSRRALMADFGVELGSVINSMDFGKVDAVAETADGAEVKKKMDALYADYARSPEGRRKATAISKEQTKRDVGEVPLAASDSLAGLTDIGAAGRGFKGAASGAAQTVGSLASEAGAGLSSAAQGAKGTGAAVSSGLSSASRGAAGTWDAVVKGFGDALRGAGLTSKAIGQETANALRANPPRVQVPRDPNAPKGGQ